MSDTEFLDELLTGIVPFYITDVVTNIEAIFIYDACGVYLSDMTKKATSWKQLEYIQEISKFLWDAEVSDNVS